MENKAQIREMVISTIRTVLNLGEEISDADLENEELEMFGYSSIDALEVLLAIEESLDLEVEDDDLQFDQLKSVKSITEYLDERILKNSEN